MEGFMTISKGRVGFEKKFLSTILVAGIDEVTMVTSSNELLNNLILCPNLVNALNEFLSILILCGSSTEPFFTNKAVTELVTALNELLNNLILCGSSTDDNSFL
jgi:hypothetical protein